MTMYFGPSPEQRATINELGGYPMECRNCRAETLLHKVPEGLSLEPLNGWYFTLETGWLCPKCAP